MITTARPPGNGTGPTLPGVEPVTNTVGASSLDARNGSTTLASTPAGRAAVTSTGRFGDESHAHGKLELADVAAGSDSRAPRFDVLLVGHDPRDPAEATIVLAAVAALCGYRADGQSMPGAADGARPPSLRDLAFETGLHIGAVRRGLVHLATVGAVIRTGSSLQVVPAALADRWLDGRRRIRLHRQDRIRALRADPLLLVGLVHGQLDARGQARLGVPRLSERLGMPTRNVERHLAELRRCGAIHTWIVPPAFHLAIAPGGRKVAEADAAPPPRPRSKRREMAEADRREVAEADAADRDTIAQRREMAEGGVAKWRWGGREVAVPPSRNGGRPSGVPGVHPDSPSGADALPRAEGETGSASEEAATGSGQQQPRPAAVPIVPDDGGRRDAERSPEPAPAAPTGPPPEPGPIIEGWLLELRQRNVERLTPGQVADLLGRLDPPGTARGPGLYRERLQFAARVVAWCPSVEQLARWLQRVRWCFRPLNVGAYLRRAVARGGDVGTVLGSHTRNQVGRAAETWRDFSRTTERALEGPHAADVARIVAGVAAVAVAVDEGQRERLRAQLRYMLEHRRPVAARNVLLRLVGSDHSDFAVVRAIGDACTLTTARELLAA